MLLLAPVTLVPTLLILSWAFAALTVALIAALLASRLSISFTSLSCIWRIFDALSAATLYACWSAVWVVTSCCFFSRKLLASASLPAVSAFSAYDCILLICSVHSSSSLFALVSSAITEAVSAFTLPRSLSKFLMYWSIIFSGSSHLSRSALILDAIMSLNLVKIPIKSSSAKAPHLHNGFC